MRKRRAKEEQKDRESLEWISGKLKIPPDILAGAPVVMMVGKHQLNIQNYRSIVEYTQERIKIQTKQGRLCIDGQSLIIDSYNIDEMCILGFISSVRYL